MRLRHWTSGLLFLACVSSCGKKSFSGGGAKPNPQPPQGLEQNRNVAQPNTVNFNIQEDSSYPVDIVFLIDGSGSMDAYVDKVRSNLPALLQAFQQQNQSFDYRLFVVSKSASFGQFEGEKFRYIPQGVGSHNALEVGQKLVNEIGGNSESSNGLRNGSVKEFVVVSDDNSNMAPDAFASWSSQKAGDTGPVHVNGIVRLGGSCGGLLSVFSDAQPGLTYQAIANNPQTRGTIQELCSPDWSGVFQGLSQQLLQRKKVAKTRFKLPQPVANPQNITVQVDGRPLAPGQEWSYDASQNEIVILADVSQSTTLTISSL